ncbi:MAG: hypothetical protein KatS3mg002_1010 [Candidatus Woesearchaeota archaeon]|nr:MAG: hypothetical protein KatS3mg002_1010 [Candidatus Woesearchaeota archaeon]
MNNLELLEIIKENLNINIPYIKNSYKKGDAVLYSSPFWDEKEILSAINSLLNGKWISSGEKVHAFEREFSKINNQKFGLMVNSGSSANLLLIASVKKYFNIPDNSEVIVSAVGFPTTYSAIILNNLKPVFIDIEFDTLNFDIEKIEEKITDKTRIIFVSPVLGNPPDYDKLIEVCKKHNLLLLTDCCDSLGTKWDNKFLPELSIASSYSFYPAHHMSCSFDTRIPYLDENNQFCFDTIENIYYKYHLNPSAIKIFTFDKENNTFWKSPKEIIQHRLNGKKMLRITTEHGRSVDVTKDHSLFILDENLNIIPIESKDLSEGDYLITSKYMNILEDNDYFNLIKIFKQNDYGEYFYVENFPSEILDNIKNRDYAYQYKIRNSIPLSLISLEEIEKLDFKNSNIALSQSSTKIPCYLYKDKKLARLIGYYLAEGNYNDGGISISLNKNEVDMVEDIKNIIYDKFNLDISLSKAGENGIILHIYSKTLKLIFKEIFNIESGAKNKRIPKFLYQCNPEVIKSFIYAYTKGDGSFRKLKYNHNRIDVTSVSCDLLNDFQYLLSCAGIFGSFYKRNNGKSKKILGKHTNSSDNFSICFHGYIYDENEKTIILSNKNFRNTLSDSIPITENLRKYLKNIPKTNKRISKKRAIEILKKNNTEIPKILLSDLVALKIRKIEELDYSNDFVYDFSISPTESFYGGFMGLFFHNSTGEGGAITSNNKEIIDIARSMAWWGRDCYCVGSANLLPNGTCQNRFYPYLKPYYSETIDHKYYFTNIGYNLKPLDLQGAIGLEQIKKGEEIHSRRINSKNTITKIFTEKIKNIKSPKVLGKSFVSWFGTPFICESPSEKRKLVSFLESKKIQTRNYFAGNILLHPAYREYGNYLDYPEANKVLDLVFFIGASPHYNNDTFEYISEVLDEYISIG